jgi:hypothetical protein
MITKHTPLTVAEKFRDTIATAIADAIFNRHGEGKGLPIGRITEIVLVELAGQSAIIEAAVDRNGLHTTDRDPTPKAPLPAHGQHRPGWPGTRTA